VDDDEDSRHVMQMMLELEGAIVEVVSSAAHALSRLATILPT